VSILDSDDFFEPDMLKKMTRQAEEMAADIVVCGGMEYDHRNGHRTKVASILNAAVIPQKTVFSYKDCPGDIYQLSQGMAWNKLYKREFLDRHSLRFQRIKFTDDAYFTFSYMVLAEKITVINEALVYYRVNSGSSQSDGMARYPESAYLPYVALKESLVEWGVFEQVRQSFVNCAAAFMRYFYERVNTFDAFRFLHEKYRNEIFDQLDISGHTSGYFYDKRLFQWYEQVMRNGAGELTFKAARSFGCDNTTVALRFQFPWRKIPKDSRIVIYGAGLMGRHFYSQIILSGYCDVVLWCENENPAQLSYIHDRSEMKNMDFDFVLIAYVQPKFVKEALAYTKSMRIPDEKIVLGGALQ
jgi:hypothetical protein